MSVRAKAAGAERPANVFSLATQQLELTMDGTIVALSTTGRAHPNVEGRVAGEAVMTRSPPHKGERHPDGDELLYLVKGVVEVEVEHEDEVRTARLSPGDAFVVPQGLWHRVIVREPCRLLFFTPGRSEVRRTR
jgi:quercetin dioxygenase-like cupin family protein